MGEKLGQGTYGLVYVAHDPHLKRLVALKVPNLDTVFRTDLRERFQREGESAARLTHPNIVTVYEVASEGPVSFIVSEFIAGPDLATWLAKRKQPVPPRHAAQVIASLAEAIEHAHARHVLHRDIKPSNIILAPRVAGVGADRELECYEPKLTDFGLAKILECRDLTQSGTVVGTPAYMPPEQIAGRNSEIGPAVDIYALGMVLYELLAGKNPNSRSGVNETIHAVIHSDLPPPRSLRPDIPRDLETICLKCLCKEPRSRYASARDLAADLNRFLQGRPILARKVSSIEKAAKWCQRYPALTLSTLAIFSLLLILLVSVHVQNTRIEKAYEAASQHLQIAEERALKLQQEAYLSDLYEVGQAWNSNRADVAIELLKKYLPRQGEPDFRDFLWWYFWNNLQDFSRVIGTHAGGASSVACTRSVPPLAYSGGSDGLIKIWKVSDGTQIGELKSTSQSAINFIQLSPDDSLLLACADDGTVRVWNLSKKSEQIVFSEHQGPVVTACFSADQKMIASGGDDAVIRLWDLLTGKQIRVITGHAKRIRGLAFHPHKDWLFSTSDDLTARAWHPSDGTPVHIQGSQPDGQFPAEKPVRSTAIEVSPDGQSVVAARLGYWSLTEGSFGKSLGTFPEQTGVRFTRWLRDGRLLVSRHSVMRLLDRSNNFKLTSESLHGHLGGDVWDAAILPEDRGLISASASGEVRLWSPAAILSDICLEPHAFINATSLKWRGDKINFGYDCGKTSHKVGIQMPQREVFRDEKTLSSDSKDHLSAASQSGREVLSVDGLTATYHRPDKTPLWTKTLSFSARDFEFDSKGQFVILFNERNGVILSTSSGKSLAEIHPPATIVQVRFLTHIPKLVITCSDETLRVWDLQNMEDSPSEVHRLRSSDSKSKLVTSAFSPDERLFASAFSEGQVILWSFPAFKELARRSVSTEQLYFVDDGRILVMQRNATQDLRFWYWQSDRLIYLLKLCENKILDVSPDGTQVALEAEHGIRIIDGKPRK
ncbi:MAG: protein kinase [Planctomycetales bacterium]